MARKLSEIVAHLRECIADGSIRTTLIQTEDLAALCDAAIPTIPDEFPRFVEDALTRRPDWRVQSTAYYAAHFLVGAKLVGGDLEANIRALARAMEKQYLIGVEHGRSNDEASKDGRHSRYLDLRRPGTEGRKPGHSPFASEKSQS